MSDPKYLTDEGSEATDFERELLQAAQGVRLTASEKQAIWAGAALQSLPTAALHGANAGANGAATTKLALSSSPLFKGLLVAVGVAGLSAGGYWLGREPISERAVTSALPKAPAASQPNTLPAEAQAPSPPAATLVAPATAATPSAHKAGSGPVTHEPSAAEKKSALRDESSAVLEIRRTLRAGDASGALHLLEQARLRFPKGALSQEREALGIEALAKSGARAAAARKAQAFLRAYPKSPYASDVQSFTGD